jgi:hypothetical protein
MQDPTKGVATADLYTTDICAIRLKKHIFVDESSTLSLSLSYSLSLESEWAAFFVNDCSYRRYQVCVLWSLSYCVLYILCWYVSMYHYRYGVE